MGGVYEFLKKRFGAKDFLVFLRPTYFCECYKFYLCQELPMYCKICCLGRYYKDLTPDLMFPDDKLSSIIIHNCFYDNLCGRSIRVINGEITSKDKKNYVCHYLLIVNDHSIIMIPAYLYNLNSNP